MVRELIQLIKANKCEDDFEKAIKHAHRSHIPEIEDIKSLHDYLVWTNGLLRWVTSEDEPAREIYNHFCKPYYILDQPPLLGLQNKIEPHDGALSPTPLSAWMVRYA